MFKKFSWPTIDVTRRSVEETAASIIKIFEIKKINENYFGFKKWSKKKILDENDIQNEIIRSNVNEEEVKISLISEGATPMLISKILQNLKQIKLARKTQTR